MTPETIDDDKTGKIPLQREDLMPHVPTTPPDDADYEESKGKYQQQLYEILETPLRPENFSTYAQDALDKVIGIVEHMTSNYPGESLPLPRAEAENYTAEYYDLDVNEILDMLHNKVDQIQQIQDFVDDISEQSEVFIPARQLERPLVPSSGESKFKETAAKLQTILFLLQERYGLDISDPAQISVTKGSVTEEMMRKEPYFLLDIPSLGRKILVCNELGNITYVMDSQKLDEIELDSQTLVNLDKSEIDTIIENNPGIGARIKHTTKYIPKIERTLKDISGFNVQDEKSIDEDADIAEESLLITKADSAPEGYKSIKKIAIEWGMSYGAIKKTIIELGDKLGKVKMARFGSKTAEAYSPDQIEMIRQAAEARGLLATEAPEGYMNARQIAIELGISQHTTKSIIILLGDKLGEVIQTRFSQTIGTAYSPDQIEMIRQAAEARGLLATEAQEGYMNINNIAKNLGISVTSVNRIIKEIGDELGAVTKAKFGRFTTDAYSPDQIEMIRQAAEARGLFSGDAPEGYMNLKQIAKEMGISESAIRKVITELGSNLSDTKMYKFGTNITEAYSPDQIEMIRQAAEARGLFSGDAPEGYMNAFQIAVKLGISSITLKKIIAKLLGELGEVIKARFGSKVTIAYSPKQIEIIRARAKEMGYEIN